MKNKKNSLIKFLIVSLLFLNLISCARRNSLPQKGINTKPTGEKIAFWAKRFIGTPYDPDTLGEYVRKNVIVADERVDCMYLVFRATELGLSKTPEEAVLLALDKRFIEKGKVIDGKVVNYENRFEYGEDMIYSGKWGKEITKDLGQTEEITGSRGKDKVLIIRKEFLLNNINLLQSGDIIFFIKNPEKRIVGEIVGHLGIIDKNGNDIFLIHASGKKNKNGSGSVVKIPFKTYIESMPFIGIKATRFD